MGQVNLYKIDVSKKTVFLSKLKEKYELIGEQNYCLVGNSETIYSVGTYLNLPETKKIPEWQWILDEYDHKIEETFSSPKAVILIESARATYAITYGLSYFIVDRYCDIDFAFDFARRINFKQIKTTTLTAPNAQRNKMINTYLNYNELSFDSGESYAKIKAKIDSNQGIMLHGETVEIGHSIKTQLPENSMDCILKFIEYVESVRKKDEIHKIPVFNRVRDENIIRELDANLLKKIEENIECINISELDIIGTTEIFNNNDTSFTLKYERKSKNIEELTKENILQFIKENNLNVKLHFLAIKVVSNKNGEPVRTDAMKRLIDFTDDKKRCLLLRGEWYSFNDDYVQYLQDSISELEVVYDSRYDFSNKKLSEYVERKYKEEKNFVEYSGLDIREVKKKIKDKYYAERVFNNVLAEQFGFENHDRESDETGVGKVELMDLYKEGTMYAVKIGNSSAKLSYVVEQSISSTRMYKHNLLPEMPKVDKIAVWIVLKRRTHLPIVNGKPDLSSLRMIMLKNRLDAWKKEVRILGYRPVVYLSYWEE
ncbi:MAG: TIGR04141 family sporadically distributed protein [Lachnospiraceae bacterium]|nr:TIGR04141 family sporadically distributed protein [Lachnospiraceae bacterium]